MIHSQDITPTSPVERTLTWAITFGESSAMDKPSRRVTPGRMSRLPGPGHIALTRLRLLLSTAKDCILRPLRDEHHILCIKMKRPDGPEGRRARSLGPKSGIGPPVDPLLGAVRAAEAAGLAMKPD